MKKFLIKILSFLSLLLIPVGIIIVGDFILLNNKSYWKLPDNVDCIVLGHSHPECAFNDSLIPNLINLGMSGEAYLYTYIKLEKIIQSNKDLKNVFIEFGTNNIDEVMDNWTWDDEHITEYFPKYFPVLNQSEFNLLWEKNAISIITIPRRNYGVEFSKVFYYSLIKRSGALSDSKEYGGYKYLDRDLMDSLVYAQESQNILNEVRDNKVSGINIYYLHKILELCKQNRIKAFLIRSPVYTLYSNRSEEMKYKKILGEEFSDVAYMDFARFPLEKKQYGDFSHLNYLGATIFSSWFVHMLDEGLLEKADKQKYIDIEIEERMYKLGNQ